MLYTIKAMATGKRMTPYNCDKGLLASAKARMAMLPPAKITLKCIQARKVRSLAKKTVLKREMNVDDYDDDEY
jgi:hypothetical protein